MRFAGCGQGCASSPLCYMTVLAYLPSQAFRDHNNLVLQMDPLGATASIVTFIQVTAVLTKSIHRIYSRWRHAPEELRALAVLLLSLGAELDIIVHCMATASHPLLVDIRSQKVLAELLREAQDCVEQFEALLTNVQEYGDFRQRTMWATNESRRMDKVIVRFRNVEDRLSHWLQAMSL